jgi:streptogramin lyase
MRGRSTGGSDAAGGDDGSRFSSFRIERPAAGITLGADRNLWLIENVPPALVRMTPAGATTTFTLPNRGSHLNGVAGAADGNVWFTEYPGDKVGRIASAGDIRLAS